MKAHKDASNEPAEQDASTLDPGEADEVLLEDTDAHMDSDNDAQLDANDIVTYFNDHVDSIFSIAQHPRNPAIVATGGGDQFGYIFKVQEALKILPAQALLFGHTDSVIAIAFTQPAGEYVVTGDMDGRLRIWQDTTNGTGEDWMFVAEAHEVKEIMWISACPHPAHPNTIALGASNGSVWVYFMDASDTEYPLVSLQVFHLHTDVCTAGAWSSYGKLLATVSADGSLYVWDVFREAAAAEVTNPPGSQTVVSLTKDDERFRIEGGLFSVAISPNGAFAAVGGAAGQIRIVGLPRIDADPWACFRERRAGLAARPAVILASLHVQKDDIESISFSAPPLSLMAVGSVDGSILLIDTARGFLIRRHIQKAHFDDDTGDEQAVIKVDFVRPETLLSGGLRPGPGSWLLTSCGHDGVVRRWDARGGIATVDQGLVGEWTGHGGAVLGFVQGSGNQVVTAGDDGHALVYRTPVV